jgi:hypothetical protein
MVYELELKDKQLLSLRAGLRRYRLNGSGKNKTSEGRPPHHGASSSITFKMMRAFAYFAAGAFIACQIGGEGTFARMNSVSSGGKASISSLCGGTMVKKENSWLTKFGLPRRPEW